MSRSRGKRALQLLTKDNKKDIIGSSDLSHSEDMVVLENVVKCKKQFSSCTSLIPFHDTVNGLRAKLMMKFKTLDNILLSFQQRKKICRWCYAVESYQTICDNSLSIEDLLNVLAVWQEAYCIKWAVCLVDQNKVVRDYELILELPKGAVDATVTTRAELFSDKLNEMVERVKDQTDSELICNTAFNNNTNILTALFRLNRELLLPPKPQILTETVSKRLRLDDNNAGKNDYAVSLQPKSCSQQISNETKHNSAPGLAVLPLDGDTNDGMDVLAALRFKATVYGEQLAWKNQLMKTQRESDVRQKILSALPAICDAMRTLSIRKNRNRMLKSDCMQFLLCCSSVNLNKVEIFQALELLATIVPTFFSMQPAEQQKDHRYPATVHISTTNIVYRDIRSTVVNYIESANNNAN